MSAPFPSPAAAPCATRAELSAWIEEHGLGHLTRLGLEAAASVVEPALWPELRAAGVGRRLLELCSDEGLLASTLAPRLKSLLAPLVWRFFEEERVATERARAEVPQRVTAPEGAQPQAVHATLLTLRGRFPATVAPRPHAALEPAKLRYDAALPGFRFEDPHPWEALPRTSRGFLRPEVRLWLSADAPRTQCSCGAATCVHQLAAIDKALCALHPPRSAELAAALAELSQAPWQRTLAALDRAFDVDSSSIAELGWRLRVIEERACELEPWLRKPGKRGQPGSTTRLTRQRLLQDHAAKLAPEDARIAALLPEDGTLASRALLESLVGHPRVVLADAPERPVEIERAAIGVVAEDRNGAVRVTAGLDGAALPLALLERLRQTSPEEPLFAFDGRRLTLLDVRPELRAALAVLHTSGDLFPPEAAASLLQSMAKWAGRLPVAMPRSVMGEATAPGLTPVLRLTAQDTGAVELSILIRPLAGGPALVPGRGARDFHLRRDDKALHTVRDLPQEETVAKALIAELPLAPAEVVPEWPFQYVFPSAHGALDLIAACATKNPAPELEWVGVPLRALGNASAGALRVTVRRKGEWFGVLGGLSVEGERVELARLLDAVRRKERYVEIAARSYVELDDALRAHLAALADHARLAGRELEVGPAASNALRALERAGALLDQDPSWAALAESIAAATELRPPAPEGLTAELRSYQLEGFQWLARLGAWQAGGVLADDMGLGKTVQALALLLERAASGPAIVLLPASVAFNWRDEAARFAPSLRVVEYGQATNREQTLATLGKGDVLLVSYGLLLRDRELLARTSFATAVFDEAQLLKNATSQRFRAAKGLSAAFKVALSGTPIENHLGELWSLYHLVFPGLFGSWESFRRRYAAAIEKRLDPEAGPALARVLAPFLLRRTKAEVEAQLPARTEVRVAVTLSSAEWQLYEDARLAALSELETRRSKLREQERRVDVLAALTRLRLLASHPRLYDARSELVSAKLERLMELVEELRAEGQRALVFSQFTSHLALVREALDRSGVEHLYLDGQTPVKARGGLVKEFQEGSAPLFLISLKAGGVGLNLTAASNVIHLDPWWNPAVEDQASDRAHRLGQTRPVTIYRLVALGTIEEQMLALHEKKRALVAEVLDGRGGSPESGADGAISTDELVALIKR